VLSSKDVKETSGFCSQYCGWHTYGTMNGVYVKFAFIGDPAACISSCSMFGGAGLKAPNNDPGADGMASLIAHELDEATTDPLLNAWYDASGEESADKCAWTFGTVTNNSYNITLGGLNFLIQQEWVYNPTPSLQGCAMSH
jgi:Phosphate-induced protein 1 conserved region